jgi:uncharacterized protein YqhQ
MAVAVRHPSGEVVVHTEPLVSRVHKSVWAKRPFIRGVLMLWDTLSLGMKALVFSANVALEEDDEKDPHPNPLPEGEGTVAQRQAETAAKDAFQGGVMWGTMILAMVFGIGLFFVSPLLLTRLVESRLPNAAASVVVEGLIRIVLFFGYVWLIGRLGDVRRVFAYHGAEHKTINAYEAGEQLTPERVGRYSVAHPRCGTAFLLYVVVLSIFVFGLLGRPSLPVRIATRIALVPVIASVAYEVIRFSARRQGNPAVRLLLIPGLALQALTTREPDDSQVQVAIAALNRVLEVDAGGAQPIVAPVLT